MNNILVTGGAGFIGSHVCEALLNKGKDVLCIDNFNNFYDPNIKENNIKNCLTNKKFKLMKLDITNSKEIEELFDNFQIDKVIHLAARAGVRQSFENPSIYLKTNIEGTHYLLEMSKEHNIKNFIF